MKRPAWTQPLGRVLLAVLYALVAVVTVRVVRDGPAYALAGGSGLALAAELTAGALLLLAGLATWRRGGRFGLLLAATAVAWAPAEWNSPAAGTAFAAGLVLSTAWAPLLAAAALRGPDERRLTWPARGLLALALAVEVGVAVAAALVFDPAREGCAACPDNRLLIAADPAAWHDLSQAGLLLSAGWTAAFALVACASMLLASPARRRVAVPVIVPAMIALGCLGATALHGFGRGFRSNDATDRVLWAVQLASIWLVAAGVAHARLRARRTRARLERLVLDLGAVETGSLRERLATLLGDPSLIVLYARHDEEGWIDARGRAAAAVAEAGREATPVSSSGRRIATLVHREGVLDDPDVVGEIETTARLALEHERLRAVRLAQLEELRAASGRIVARADAERRRLERDLHDGAQQRLVTAAVGVTLARRRHEDDTELGAELAAVERELADAAAELRHIGHGIFPAALGAEGLGAALELLAESEHRLVLAALPAARSPAAVESAAYHVVEQALQITRDGDVEVDADRRDGSLLVEIRAPGGFGPVPPRVSDRIRAVGGTLTATDVAIQVELPCAS